MTSINDAAPFGQSPPLAASSSSARLPRTTDNIDLQSPSSSSLSSLPYRTNTSASTLFAATTPPGSRPLSPSGRISTPRILSETIFGGKITQESNPQDRHPSSGDDPRPLIAHAFVPHVAVFPSQDTDDLIREKGFSRGLWQLLRPFGDNVQGKVIIRDSIGASRVYEDFAIRFVQLGSGYERPINPDNFNGSATQASSQHESHITEDRFTTTGGNIEAIENVVDLHLDYAENFLGLGYQDHSDGIRVPAFESEEISPFYALYLRRLLSGMPLVPYETFSHPVACIIAISSRNPNPIEELRRLYEEATRGEKRLPPWVNGEYLRYYVLVHDEERDDIGKAMSLFDQMKRHFGLHCHLLRLRSSRCAATDDDSVVLPTCKWMSATEELLDIQTREDQDGLDVTPPCIFESDATAITTFIREMVTQSVVPSMERCVSTWNDQVASRRRGISGRFMSLSKKWTVFGNGSRVSSGGPGVSGGSNNNYDSLQGFYQPDTPESIMRKLADYAFMLRDWKLAQSVYELLRSDFNNDKAWKYYAAASEMAAISTLLASQATSSKVRVESVDQMLESSCYSYLTRCNSPYGASRCLVLSMELLKIRGESASEDAAKWGAKIIESNMLGATGDALMKERIAICYRSRKGTGSGGWGSRARKSALWDMLAADKWLIKGKYVQAQKILCRVRNVYNSLPSGKGISGFLAADDFLAGLEQNLRVSLPSEDLNDLELSEEVETQTFEVDEVLHARTHRKSLTGATIPTIGSLETAPLHMVQESIGGMETKEAGFS